MTSPPVELSVVLATDDAATIERGLTALLAQTARDRIELVLVPLAGRPLDVDRSRLEPFAAAQILEPAGTLSLAVGRVAGLRAARGRFVHIGETHAFPHPDWAEHVLGSLDGTWTAIVSGHENANPTGVLSWANLVADYGPWLAHLPAGELHEIPPYNTAFERSFALEAIELDPDAFTGGFDLAGLCRDRGRRMLLQSAARIDHVNVDAGSAWLGQRFTSARVRAGRRSHAWSRRQRAGYALASPLIPVVLASRLARPLLAAQRAWHLPWLTAPALLLGLTAQAGGELTSFVAGESAEAAVRADEFEINKTDYARLDP